MTPPSRRIRKTRRRSSPTLDVLESRLLLTRGAVTPIHAAALGVPAAAVVHAEATPTISVADVVVTEPGRGKSVRVVSLVTLSAPATKKVRITYRAQGVTAALGRDFLPARGVLTIAKGQTVGRIRTVVLGDKNLQTDAYYNVALNKATNATLPVDSSGILPFSRVVVRDNTPGLVRPTLSISGPTVIAGQAATFFVTLSSVATRDVSVRYFTLSSTADTSRYTPQEGTLYFYAGMRTVPVPVPTTAGILADGPQQFTLQLDAAANADLVTTSATATILEAPVVTLPVVTVRGGTTSVEPSATSKITFEVSLSAPSPSGVSVDFSTSDGTAASGTDYAATTGTIAFFPGQTSRTVDVTVFGEPNAIGTKSFSLILSNPINAQIASASALGVISYGLKTF